MIQGTLFHHKELVLCCTAISIPLFCPVVLVLTSRLLTLMTWFDHIVWGDSYSVMQILKNMIQNCIKIPYLNTFQSFFSGCSVRNKQYATRWKYLTKKRHVLDRNHTSLYTGLQISPPSPLLYVLLYGLLWSSCCSSQCSPAVLAHSHAAAGGVAELPPACISSDTNV